MSEKVVDEKSYNELKIKIAKELYDKWWEFNERPKKGSTYYGVSHAYTIKIAEIVVKYLKGIGND